MLTGRKIDDRFLDNWERDLCSELERDTGRPFALVRGDRLLQEADFWSSTSIEAMRPPMIWNLTPIGSLVDSPRILGRSTTASLRERSTGGQARAQTVLLHPVHLDSSALRC